MAQLTPLTGISCRRDTCYLCRVRYFVMDILPLKKGCAISYSHEYMPMNVYHLVKYINSW